MREKVLTTTSGQKIYVYDDVFTPTEQYAFKRFAENSSFRVLKGSIGIEDYNVNTLFQSSYDENDMINFGIYRSPSVQELLEKHYSGLVNSQNWVIASNPANKNYFHPDVEHTVPGAIVKTFLYYLNLKWDLNDGGETLFCDEHGDVEIAISSKPNRVAVYDASILHKACSTDVDVRDLRFAFVSKWTNL